MYSFRDKNRKNGGAAGPYFPASRFPFHVSRLTFHVSRLFLFLCLLLIFAGSVSAEIETWTVGNEARPWEAWGTMRMMDTRAESGAIQPSAFQPDENIVPTFQWYPKKFPSDPDYRKGDPRAWLAMDGAYSYAWTAVDGDPTTVSTRFLSTVTSRNHSFWTLDFGVPIPACTLVFYPRQEGVDQYENPSVNNFMKGYKISGGLGKDFPVYEKETYAAGYTFGDIIHLEHVLGSTEYNKDSVVRITFPPEFIRLLRVQNIVDLPFELAEIEVYADGLAATATYTSRLIDLGDLFNFGTSEWSWTKLRRAGDGALVATPDADVSVQVETRSGSDDSPLVHHKTLDTGGEMVITEEEYYHGGLKPAPISAEDWVAPNQQGSITDDTEHWSFWSLPHTDSGEAVTSPGPRRYFQFRITLKTNEVNELARVDSLSFQISPPLADEVVGEVAALADPAPLNEVAHVAGGERTTFTYDLRATASPGQTGFDGLDLTMPSEVAFGELLMGYPLAALPREEYEVESSGSRLVVRFPSHRITDGTLVRVVFDTSVLVFGTRFVGKVFDTEGDHLSQPIQPGNANEAVSTDKLWVWVTEESLQAGILTMLEVTPVGAITPNGDGINDAARISYTLLQLTGEALVELSIRDLSGRQVRSVYRGRELNGRYDQSDGAYPYKVWDGKDDDGKSVPPGLYLYALSVKTDSETARKVGRIAVVY